MVAWSDTKGTVLSAKVPTGLDDGRLGFCVSMLSVFALLLFCLTVLSNLVFVSQRLEDASQVAVQLQEHRQQKTREMKEQLRNFLGSPKETSDNPSPPQSEGSLLEKEEKERIGKEKWKGFHAAQFSELENSYRGRILEEKAKLHDQLERGEIQKWSKEKLMREHEETVTFLRKAFQQDVRKLKWRMEKEQKGKYSSRQDGNPSVSEAVSSQNQPGLAEEERIRSFLAENIRILKQIELLVTVRIVLLNPWIRPRLPDAKDAGGMLSSQLLALLKDVNCQMQKCAAAVGLLDVRPPGEEAANSFQDIMDIQMIPKSGQLEPLHASSLSAREFVIYQYGIIVLQFLRPHVGGPEIELCIASSIPPSGAPGNAFRNSFYYQNPGHKLFISREALRCVGSFLLLVVHSLAHITAGDLSHDSSPAFRRLFHQALKTCLGEMFSLRLQSAAMLEGSKSAVKMINEAFLKREAIADEQINLFSGLSDAKAKPSTDTEKNTQDLKQHLGLLLDAPLLRSNLSPEKKEHSSHLDSDIHETVPAGR
ncbi:uncharacterized protein LOC123036847 [Varanus komodoensis]|uniref:uncharacterized protein LOC123036847 n=1 Tax=Varanus komodoensis TaxID=61221 RepID=UPI001CF7A45F|nr:uncharacterized protein LOC123036847 [Varanus komodoensis]